jgi:hypothetical protein
VLLFDRFFVCLMFDALFLNLPSFGLFWFRHILAFSEPWLKSWHSNHLVAFDGLNVLRCDCSRAAGGGFALFVNRSIKATLAYKSAAGSYFEYVLVPFASMMSPF